MDNVDHLLTKFFMVRYVMNGGSENTSHIKIINSVGAKTTETNTTGMTALKNVNINPLKLGVSALASAVATTKDTGE